MIRLHQAGSCQQVVLVAGMLSSQQHGLSLSTSMLLTRWFKQIGYEIN